MRSFPSTDPRTIQRDRFESEVGHLPDDPPDEARWQWEYTGSRVDRERLDLIHEIIEVEVNQESLF